ncbi:GNAT family N-acetyltransferase [Catellatospora sp. NPDC049609]|uniref:GNAT family N-acetyltransferase n=1 Tax=Catellatospora sp. NPDC049609 TaxID=3155505 RepID=UPI0034145E90
MTESALIVRQATGPADTAALSGLRRAWTAEQAGAARVDPDFEARFQDWLDREGDRRVCWLAEHDGQPVGMVNLAVFERMPRPGQPPSRWGYLGNAYVLPAHRDTGVGAALVAALLAYARAEALVRVVLSPSARSVPFYERAGFHRADELMLLTLD